METMMQHVLQNWMLLPKHWISTFLLVNKVNNVQKDFLGHYTNINPKVGSLASSLASTARTFILDGIATEYATQVMGRTLDKGHLFAQYMKRSSRLHYDSSQQHAYKNILLPPVVSSWVGDNLELRTKSQSEIHSNKPFTAYELEWQSNYDILLSDDGNILADNTDFYNFSGIKRDKLTNQKCNNNDEYYTPLRRFIYVKPTSGSEDASIIATKKFESKNELRVHPMRSIFVRETNADRRSENLLIHKPISNKKSIFSYSSKIKYELCDDVANKNKLNVLSDGKLSTITYYGFSDFTTIVGESVIIYSSSTSTHYLNLKVVTSVKNGADLSGILVKGDIVHARSSYTTGFTPSNEKTGFTSGNKWLKMTDARIVRNDVSNTKISVNGYGNSWNFDANMLRTSIYTSVPNSLPSAPEVLEMLTSLSRAKVIRKTAIPVHTTEVFSDHRPFTNSATQRNILDYTNIAVVYTGDIKEVLGSNIQLNTIISQTSSVTYGDIFEKKNIKRIALETSTFIDGNSVDIKPIQTMSYDKVIHSGDYINFPKDCVGTSQIIFVKNSKTISQIDKLFKRPFGTKEGDGKEEVTTSTFNNIYINHHYFLGTKSTAILPSILKPANNKTKIVNPSQFGRPLGQAGNGDELIAKMYNNMILVTTEFKGGSELFKRASEHSLINKETDIVYTTEEDLVEEVELIYKTLFTTYIYLTTFFKENRTSISSDTEVFTNIFTATLQRRSEDIDPTSVVTHIHPVNKSPEELLKNISAEKRLIENIKVKHFKCQIHECSKESTTKIILESNINKLERIYLTTFTYYTTVFEEDKMKILSKMGVFTNYVTDGITSTTLITKKNATCEIMKSMSQISAKEKRLGHDNKTYYNNLISNKFNIGEKMLTAEQKLLNYIIMPKTPKATLYNYNNTLFNIINKVDSSSSDGDRHINQKLKVVRYQTGSESNTDLILPSATLLLQTSFTTFTYYTTKYNGDISNIVAYLEIVTNISTETLQPSKTVDVDEATSITHKTPILDNISEMPSNTSNAGIVKTTENIIKPTSNYTTYTYYTTSYRSDKTIIDSRFEIITNVIKSTKVLTPTKGNFISDTKGAVDIFNVSTKINPFSTKVVNKGTLPLSSENQIILYDYKKVVDAEGISTFYFTTVIYPTSAIDGMTSEFATTSSSLYVDEAKKSLMLGTIGTKINGDERLLAHQYKTGLVRLIVGMRIGNHTTTSYQSKVIGTFIENRYAQIIESTSSFYLKSNKFTSTRRLPAMPLVSTQSAQIPINNIQEPLEHIKKHSDYETNELLLPFQLIKPTFTPVIRSFISQNRPQFAPQKRNSGPSGATIVTGIDFTPTITATPAMKIIGRFTSSRKGILSNTSLLPITVGGSIDSIPRRLFGRPVKLLHLTGKYVGTTTSINTPRISLSSQPSVQFLRQAEVLLRNSSSSGFSSNAHVRIRIKPTNLTVPGQKNIETDVLLHLTSENNDNVESSTFKSLENRNQNNSLRFRKPVNRPFGATAAYHLTPEDSFSKGQKALIARVPIIFTATASHTSQIGSLIGKTRSQSRICLPQNQTFQEKIVTNTEEKINESIQSISNNEYGSEYYGEHWNSRNDDDTNNNRFRHSKSKMNKSMEWKTSKISKLFYRVRREAKTSFQTRSSFRNRFRHPNFSSISKRRNYIEAVEPATFSQESLASLHRTKSRSIARYTAPHRKPATLTAAASANTKHHGSIRRTRSTNVRLQFTLRDKNANSAQKSHLSHSTSNFRRSQNMSSSRRLSVSSSNNRRLKALTGNSLSQDFPSRSILPRTRSSLGRTRTTVRGRNRNEQKAEQGVLPYENIITATHIIPTEVTIPVVNGKITEYKNVVTEKTSTELLGPEQYTSFVGSNGQTMLALKRADSSVNYVGATEITQYILHESPTTTVVFTPTTIRGRKTSFSHVIPSTVYSVKNVISTSPPKISTNVPLANILLSQLLLGNIDLHAANPLLNALSTAVTPVSNQLAINALGAQVPIPVTEYRTHTSTYVTTVYEGMSTIVSVMFQGKKILTTVYDTSKQTITVTEFITDTIVTTPTRQPFTTQTSEVNSLLLQQLLLQQELQPKFEQPQLPTLHSPLTQLTLTDILHSLDTSNMRPSNENDMTTRGNKTSRKKARKPGKIQKGKHQATQGETLENSNIITLYVSGKRPGEFSTILSTVVSDHDSTIYKRQAHFNGRQTVNVNNIYVPRKIKCLHKKNKHLELISQTNIHLFENVEHSFRVQSQMLESAIGGIEAWQKTSSHGSTYKESKLLNMSSTLQTS